MKWGVSVVGLVLVASLPLAAAPLELFVGAGPAAASFSQVNASIGVINVLLRDLNATPTFEGNVPDLPLLSSGTAYQGGEWYEVADRLAVGGKIEAFHTETATAGSYLEGTEVSQIAFVLASTSVSAVVGGRLDLLTAPLRLSIELGAVYNYCGFASDVTFEVPASYPPISIHPPEGRGRYSASSIGLEGGVSLAVPIASWLHVRASVTYRLLTEGILADAAGTSLDIDGNGVAERVDLNGVSVQFGLGFVVALPLGERKE